MTYTGLATAIGLDVDVPHIIRLLASDLYQARGRRDRADFSQSLHLYLDSGTAVPVPHRFAKCWWRVNRDPVSEEVLGPQTIDECLKTHRKHQEEIEKKRKAEDAPAGPLAWVDERVLQPGPSRLEVPAVLLSQGAVTLRENMMPNCPSCVPNRDAALEAFTKNQKHVRRLKVVRDAFQERRDAAARRAAGFLKLYEAAIAKEVNEDGEYPVQQSTSMEDRVTTRSKGKRSDISQNESETFRRSELVRQRAEEELQSLIDRGPGPQWSAGPKLDLHDIRGLLQFGPAVRGGEHSGYHLDHPTGRMTGSDSEQLSAPNSKARSAYSDTIEKDEPAPDLATEDIPRLRQLGTVAGPDGDPLHRRVPPIPSYHINPIDDKSIDEGSGEGDADNESESVESDDDDVLALHGPGDALNPIVISSRSSSHVSLSSDSLGNPAEALDINESSHSDEIAGPLDALGTADSRPAKALGTTFPVSDEDLIAIGNYIFDHAHEFDNSPEPATVSKAMSSSSDELATAGDALASSDDDDDDMLAGPEDALWGSDGQDDAIDEDDEDDVDDEGLAGRIVGSRVLGDSVTGPMAGPSRERPRDHPYTAEDFKNVPDAWFL